MLSRVSQHLAVVTFPLVVAMAACSDDSPTGGGSDTTPPDVLLVTPIDEYHVNVLFTERVSRPPHNSYHIVEAGLPVGPNDGAAPGDPLQISAAVLLDDERTVALTTEASMAGNNYTLSFEHVEDVSGNRIETPIERVFTGSSAADVTPPEAVNISPGSGATGLALETVVRMQFTEPIDAVTFFEGVTWSRHDGSLLDVGMGGGGTDVRYSIDGSVPLEPGTIYTVRLHGIEDLAGNTMPDTEWSFATMTSFDRTPPTLVSTSPANLTTNIDVNTTISLTFSEPMNKRNFHVTFTPRIGGFGVEWSDDGRTVVLHPLDPLQQDLQYEVSILDGGFYDLAGNGIVGFHSIVFSTGPSLNNGSIAGVIAGDAGSPAADPSGAVVMAVQEHQAFLISAAGHTIVNANNTYNLSHLPDGVYFPFAVLDTNGDHLLDPWRGDAIGAYGIESWPVGQWPDSVVISGQNHATDINFSIVDASAIDGYVTYEGVHEDGSWIIRVGLFAASGFDPSDSPVATTTVPWPSRAWRMLSIYEGFADGNYYVGAYIDLDQNGYYDAASEPMGMYGGIHSPTALNVTHGVDFLGITIPIVDPSPEMRASTVVWPAVRHNAALRRLFASFPRENPSIEGPGANAGR